MPNNRLLLAGQWLLVAAIALVFVVAVAKPIVLTASDLGRHLTNGRLFLETGTVATTNLYSYTHPDFPFLNHHWGSGVLFEVARRAGGFLGVSLFGLSVVFLTALLYLRIAWRHGKLWLVMAAAAVTLPIFSGRAEIRPELFSYLLSAVFLWMLLGVRSKTMSPKALIALPILTLLWVNLHIYFFLGIGWVGAFLLDALLRAWLNRYERTEHLLLAKRLAIALGVMCLLTPLNPNGWKGALYPLLIFENYAYAVAENQTVTKILAYGDYPPAEFFKVALAILWISWAWRLYRAWRERELPDIALLILSLFVSIIGWNAIRNFTIFSYVALVAIAYAWSDLSLQRLSDARRRTVQTLVPVVLTATMVVFWPSYWKLAWNTIGVGASPGILRSIEFFKENDLQGPIFNNYDIGGFLTYGLYPQERVFVDNRPEAYPGDFFTDTLLPMQLKDDTWRQIDARVNFNVIFFYRHDATRWGQQFMIRRLQDPAWAPVFVDDFVLMLVRRTPENTDVIAAHELPKSMFDVKPRQR